jgi:hypothetical protein
MPGKREDGPSDATRTTLIRQSKASLAPAGETAISVVSPPPFFRDMRRHSADRMTRIELDLSCAEASFANGALGAD